MEIDPSSRVMLFAVLAGAIGLDLVLKWLLYRRLERWHRGVWLEVGAPRMPALSSRDETFVRVIRVTRFIWTRQEVHGIDPVIGRLVYWARGAEALAVVLFVVGVACIVTGSATGRNPY